MLHDCAIMVFFGIHGVGTEDGKVGRGGDGTLDSLGTKG